MLDLEYILQRPSKEEFQEAAVYLTQNTAELLPVFEAFKTGTTKERNRSAWLLQQASDVDASVFEPHHDMLLAHAPTAKTDAEKRFIARLFAYHGLPKTEDAQGILLQQAFDWLINSKESIAVKAHCLDIAFHFTKIHPEIAHELREIIDDQYERSTAAFKARAKKILKKLPKNQPPQSD